MKLLGIFLAFVALSSANTQSTPSPAPLTWTQFKAQLKENFKNISASTNTAVQRENDKLWKLSCPKISTEVKDEFQVILFLENIQDILPKNISSELKEQIKFELAILMGDVKVCGLLKDKKF